jgi:hypothetical protein
MWELSAEGARRRDSLSRLVPQQTPLQKMRRLARIAVAYLRIIWFENHLARK